MYFLYKVRTMGQKCRIFGFKFTLIIIIINFVFSYTEFIKTHINLWSNYLNKMHIPRQHNYIFSIRGTNLDIVYIYML